MLIRYTEPGFYKYKNELLYAKTGIYGEGYHLDYWEHDTYKYPIDGWYWFNDGEEALNFFSLYPEFHTES